jgi:plastocyanin
MRIAPAIFIVLLLLGGTLHAGSYSVRGEALLDAVPPAIHPIPTAAYLGACGKMEAVIPVELVKTRIWRRRITNIAMWLEPIESGGLESSSASTTYETLKINEDKCRFVPQIAVVPVGTRIEIWNEDRKDHLLLVERENGKVEQYVQRYTEDPSAFTFDTPNTNIIPRGQPVVIKADRPGKISIKSGMHRWMEGWIVVVKGPFIPAVPAKDGLFTLKDISGGEYRLHVWHPYLGENSGIVRLPEDNKKVISISYHGIPKQDAIPSTLVSTEKEIKEEKDVWEDMDNW